MRVSVLPPRPKDSITPDIECPQQDESVPPVTSSDDQAVPRDPDDVRLNLFKVSLHHLQDDAPGCPSLLLASPDDAVQALLPGEHGEQPAVLCFSSVVPK